MAATDIDQRRVRSFRFARTASTPAALDGLVNEPILDGNAARNWFRPAGAKQW